MSFFLNCVSLLPIATESSLSAAAPLAMQLITTSLVGTCYVSTTLLGRPLYGEFLM